MPIAQPDHLVLSPHLDDAALSCGGAIHALAAQGAHVLVVTPFTGDLPAEHARTRLARRNERSWGLPARPFAARCEEDLDAMALLGAHARHLGLLDMIYRTTAQGEPAYRDEVIGVAPHADDLARFLPHLVEQFQALAGTLSDPASTVFCPLGLGGHVDHVLVRRAAESVWPVTQLIYYEDYPYAERPDVLQAWQAAEGTSGPWLPQIVPLDETDREARIAAVIRYRSQLIGLFPSGIDRWLEIVEARTGLPVNRRRTERTAAAARRLRAGMHDYIAQVGGERYWRRAGQQDLPPALAGLMQRPTTAATAPSR